MIDEASIEKQSFELLDLLIEVPSPISAITSPVKRVGEGPVFDLGEAENIILETKDHFGQIVSRFKMLSNTMVGLDQLQYKLLRSYTDRIFDMAEFKEKTTRDFLEAHTFDWLTTIYERKKAEKSLLNYLKDVVSDEDRDYTFYFRIRPLILKKGFSIGHAEITFFTQDFFDSEEQKFVKSGKSKEQFNDFMQQFSDCALVKVKASGVEDRAFEDAKKKAELAVAVLKCLLHSYPVHGQFKIPDIDHNATQKNAAPYLYHYPSELSTFTFGLTIMGELAPIEITHMVFEDLEKKGISSFSAIISASRDTDFYHLVIGAIKSYSNLLSESNKYTRIVKLISFFETILIDPSKRTGGGETLLVKTLIPKLSLHDEDQRLLIDLSHHFYRIRDAYVHHGQEKMIDPEKLGQFQSGAFIFLKFLVDIEVRYKSIDEFYDYLKSTNPK